MKNTPQKTASKKPVIMTSLVKSKFFSKFSKNLKLAKNEFEDLQINLGFHQNDHFEIDLWNFGFELENNESLEHRRLHHHSMTSHMINNRVLFRD